jgi:hypothetical protein
VNKRLVAHELRSTLPLVAAAVVLPCWVAYELRVGEPMVDIRTASRRPVLLTNITLLLVGFALYCNNLSSTSLLQLPKETGFGFGLSIGAAGWRWFQPDWPRWQWLRPAQG